MKSQMVMKKQTTRLDEETFNRIVRSTPLISIDLITVGEDGQVMLGLRKNRPSKGLWFVPGGRIMKNETIREAFQRISASELGFAIPFRKEGFLGVYEHLYPDENFAGEEGYGTHYIVLAFTVHVKKTFMRPPMEQHNSFRWFHVADLLKDAAVHPYTKDYFNGTDPVR